MKKEIHPEYQEVLFVDSTTNYKFVCGSTLKPKERDTFNGKEYPVYRLSTSSASHPFFTGSKTLVDAEGRVDKFKKRWGATQPKIQERTEEELEAIAKEHEKEQHKPAPKAAVAAKKPVKKK